MKKVLIATTNQAKLAEYRKYLSDLPLELLDLTAAGITQKADESGETMTENAIIKAQFYHELSGLPTIADDGGFEVDALGGAPGVHSHRVTHKDREDTDEEIINYIISQMKTVQPTARGAQLRLIAALMLPSKEVFTIEEADRGTVGLFPCSKREAGFPYRSLLYFPKIKKYYSELTPEEATVYNHRKRAIERMKPIIKKYVVGSSK
jgi:XTP/dITP diphosphohydrolase